MKKLLIISIAIFSVAITNAQTTFGAKAGLNLASIKVSVASLSISTSNRTSFVIGGFAHHKVSDVLAIQPEILYQGMGGTVNNETLTMGYLAIPVLAKYSVTKNVELEAGPQLGFILSANSGGENVKDQFKSTDLQFLIGGGINLTDKLQAGVRYGIGMSNIANDGKASYSNGFDGMTTTSIKVDAKTNALGIFLSYKL